VKLAVNYPYHALAFVVAGNFREGVHFLLLFHASPSTRNTNNERWLGTSQMLLKMATNISGIPVVDFSAMSLQNESSVKENSDAVKQLADHVHQAFSTIGFVYLKNHGISQEKVACKHV